MAIKFMRVHETARSRGRCRTSLYDDIKAGLWPQGVRLGKRAVGWPVHEADQLNGARIAGLSEDQIRLLVKSLVDARSAADPNEVSGSIAVRSVSLCDASVKGGIKSAIRSMTPDIINVNTAQSALRSESRSRYPRTLAVHEAGHAVATIVQGGLVDAIQLRSRRECRDGDAIPAGGGSVHAARGATSATNFSNIMFSDMAKVTAPIRRDLAVKDMVVLFAGPCAEIRQRHGAGRRAFDQPGASGDQDEIEALAKLLPDGQAAVEEACSIAVSLVRSYWSTIQAVADVLQENRHTPGAVVTSIVRRYCS